jgi:polyhydroxyalkanoate synthase
MARAFSAIRSEDLIYSRAVRRYYLGKEDLPTDMGVWVSDTTRMPARMHSEYLRGLFLENRLTAGRFAVNGTGHRAQGHLGADIRGGHRNRPHRAVEVRLQDPTVHRQRYDLRLTSGGHNSGIVNEPKLARGHHRISRRAAGALYVGPEAWFAQNTPQPGSWWPAWTTWLEEKSSGVVPAPSIGAPDKGLAPDRRHPAPTFTKPDPWFKRPKAEADASDEGFSEKPPSRRQRWSGLDGPNMMRDAYGAPLSRHQNGT